MAHVHFAELFSIMCNDNICLRNVSITIGFSGSSRDTHTLISLDCLGLCTRVSIYFLCTLNPRERISQNTTSNESHSLSSPRRPFNACERRSSSIIIALMPATSTTDLAVVTLVVAPLYHKHICMHNAHMLFARVCTSHACVYHIVDMQT